MDSKKNVIIKTLSYSDIFDFPLNKEEIHKYLITDKKISEKDFTNFLKVKEISSIENFYFLSGREKIVKIRKKREKIGLSKIEKAKIIINSLVAIPSIYFLGITGSLALLNSEENEDIDLFMICAKDTVWITRFLTVMALKLSGSYRSRTDKFVKDKICLNMIIGEDCLEINHKRQDVYTAHEIVQLMPIFDRKNTYKRFLNSNLWVKKFMHNFTIRNVFKASKKEKKWMVKILKFFEPFFREMQFYSMKKHITREIVTDNFLAFHPIDYRGKILKEFNKRIKND
jgi:hypothetical protein